MDVLEEFRPFMRKETIKSITIPNKIWVRDYFGKNKQCMQILGIKPFLFSSTNRTNSYIGGSVSINEIVISDGIEISPNTFFRALVDKVVLPNTCENIPEYCFYASSISKLEGTENIKSIGDEAFRCCSFLENITFPNSVESIGEYAFADSELIDFDWPSACEVIPKGCFSNCSNLYKVSNLENVKTIRQSAFCETGLTKTPNLSSVTLIEPSAFFGCKLEFFNWPANCKVVPANCFHSCGSLKFVYGLDSVMEIEEYAFALSGIETIIWPSSCRVIPKGCFCNCRELTSAHIPNGTYTICNIAFAGIPESTILDFSKSIVSLDGPACTIFTDLKSFKAPYFLI